MNQTAANRVSDHIHRLDKVKDKRQTYIHHRIEHEGNVWNIDAKLDPDAGRLIVYRIYGDITNKDGFDAAIDTFFNAEMLRIYTKREAARSKR